MEIYDVVMLAVLIGATLIGFWKGLAWQIASIASLVASYFLSLKFSEQLAQRLHPVIVGESRLLPRALVPMMGHWPGRR